MYNINFTLGKYKCFIEVLHTNNFLLSQLWCFLRIHFLQCHQMTHIILSILNRKILNQSQVSAWVTLSNPTLHSSVDFSKSLASLHLNKDSLPWFHIYGTSQNFCNILTHIMFLNKTPEVQLALSFCLKNRQIWKDNFLIVLAWKIPYNILWKTRPIIFFLVKSEIPVGVLFNNLELVEMVSKCTVIIWPFVLLTRFCFSLKFCNFHVLHSTRKI